MRKENVVEKRPNYNLPWKTWSINWIVRLFVWRIFFSDSIWLFGSCRKPRSEKEKKIYSELFFWLKFVSIRTTKTLFVQRAADRTRKANREVLFRRTVRWKLFDFCTRSKVDFVRRKRFLLCSNWRILLWSNPFRFDRKKRTVVELSWQNETKRNLFFRRYFCPNFYDEFFRPISSVVLWNFQKSAARNYRRNSQFVYRTVCSSIRLVDRFYDVRNCVALRKENWENISNEENCFSYTATRRFHFHHRQTLSNDPLDFFFAPRAYAGRSFFHQTISSEKILRFFDLKQNFHFFSSIFTLCKVSDFHFSSKNTSELVLCNEISSLWQNFTRSSEISWHEQSGLNQNTKVNSFSMNIYVSASRCKFDSTK